MFHGVKDMAGKQKDVHTHTHTHALKVLSQPSFHVEPFQEQYCMLCSLGTSFKDRMSFTILRPYVYSDLRNMG